MSFFEQLCVMMAGIFGRTVFVVTAEGINLPLRFTETTEYRFKVIHFDTLIPDRELLARKLSKLWCLDQAVVVLYTRGKELMVEMSEQEIETKCKEITDALLAREKILVTHIHKSAGGRISRKYTPFSKETPKWKLDAIKRIAILAEN